MAKDNFKTKIGLFLGSFDPFHQGHKDAVREALRRGMSKVWVIPTQINPWKTEKPEPLDQRFWIAHNMLLDQKDAQVLCVVCDPDSNDGKYYSVDQLKKILRGYGSKNFEFWIIGGSDVASEIGNWKEGDWILGNFKVLEIPRPGYTAEETYTTPISGTELRSYLRAENWEIARRYMNTEALKYIQENNLYQESEEH